MLRKSTSLTLGILAVLVFALTAVSALQISNLNRPTSVNEDAASYTFTFNIVNNGGSVVNVSFPTIASFGSVSIPAVDNLSIGESRSVTGTVSNFANQGGNDQSITINATATDASFTVTSFTTSIISVLSLCVNGSRGDLFISDFSVNNLGDGDDEEWWPLDKVEIEVEVENQHSDDSVRSVNVEIVVLDDKGNDVTSDFDFDDEKISLGTIKSDDSKTATFVIPEVPADLDEGKYRLYFKAYSKGDEDIQCIDESSDFNNDKYHEVEFTRDEDEAVVVRPADLLDVLTTTCGDSLAVSVPIYNIGIDKEESILVNLYNKDLGLDAYDKVEDLRSGKRTEMNFVVKIPSTAKEGRYKLDVFTFFNYDEDGDKMSESSYDSNSYEDLDKDFKIQVDVVGCAVQGPSITAALDSEAKLGSELVVRTTITNPSDAKNYIISVSGTDGWADVVSVTPQSVTVAKAGTQDVLVRLNPSSAGFHSFSIDVTADGKTFSQPVSVNIAGEGDDNSGFSFSNFDSKTLTYVIIGLVVLIILIIIILLVKLTSKGRSSDRF